MIKGHRRIMVIGKPGSGKTVFADRLGKAIGRKVTHLDTYYWKPDWTKAYSTTEEFKDKVRELASESEWIIDGNFTKSIDIRLERADTVIFFNFPAWRAILGVYKRWLFGGNNLIDKHPGMRERVDFSLIRMIVFYDSKQKYEMLKSVTGKRIFIIKSRQDAERAFQDIVNELKG